ncbi:hypothetical protein DFJ67_7327 [Asanoa ferruginea]|uniref:PRC-barrel domain protein n=1 Tax=Asanoa ferruginea TaxID=53367 RepID=A0A3D9ZV85_9ACTN|nr:hypothetical protein [Asanoa ferruginea]REG01247.1 hypothetical protein DFJ67_7327 [Asanoa ferruginea]GIF53066.1 hypothetical protein Afe04nite_76050 [Asanoa ferruginea]
MPTADAPNASDAPDAAPEVTTDPPAIAQVTPGMEVQDATGVPVGLVGAVQQPDTEVRPELPAGPAEFFMANGYLLVDRGEQFENNVYVSGDQVDHISGTGDGTLVTLNVSWDELDRAVD